MSALTPEQLEIAELIIEAVNLEDIEAEEINPDDPIFTNGLGLDSIDALEISLELSKKYGVKIGAGDENVNEIFSSVASLTDYVQKNKKS
ncbi:acyl carrier protein [Thiomicrorhabdus immobilis]|uniref:Acyl carrier protein n=1 Tax=Thiomicrorhabdus immobilis TaxID=2791037 RepID=A0ABM7MCE9_9GAMM|nr:phosphopantetheine-binding protein [Thiomicrorhabdus immobilis]BCN93089.1 acyl carrier protein [Thiomicrorhabdus immobilis]